MYHIDGYGIAGLFICLGIGSHSQQFINLAIRKSLQPQAFPWDEAADPHIRVYNCLIGIRSEGIGNAVPYPCPFFILAGIGSID